ncbi:maleylacetoacetate isomerase MaiA [Histoplasma capsulatum]|uniref:Maleylacetoacetate isomerase MaiA n=2 Tax=Histoplasma TaxID=5036 RepID=A0A8A1MK86_AJECA|nr:maleylacetoacetate isomerase MaiA [Histoplasma capsulatum]
MASENPRKNPQFHLYSYYRSSCAARLRIALNLKQIPYTTTFVNLLKGEQLSPAHRALNPSATVPILIITSSSNPNPTTFSSMTDNPTTSITIGQSIAALEYLEEISINTNTNTTPLLPPSTSPDARAQVRTLVNIIACDIQPVTNLRIQQRVKALGADNTLWAHELMEAGFAALEAQMLTSAGQYSVGDDVSMADVCLVPAVWAAQRFGVDLGTFPTVSRVAEMLESLEAVRRAHWARQPDTPEELRAVD